MLALKNDSCQSVLYTRGKNLSVISRGFGWNEAIVQYCVNDRAGNKNARSMQANCSAIDLGYGDSRHMAFSFPALSNRIPTVFM